VQVAVPGLLLLLFAARGAFPELRGPRRGVGAWLADVALGLAIAALWTVPYLAIEALPGPPAEGAFDPQVFTAAWGARGDEVAWALRGLGFVAVTPFAEELFVRSLLWRWIAAGAGRDDFREVPVGVRDARAAVGTTILFTLAHVMWEWPVALLTGALLAAWLWRTRDLRACIWAHAAANGAIFLLGWLRPGTFAVFL
jgi:CAAX prenyl protease-like protein